MAPLIFVLVTRNYCVNMICLNEWWLFKKIGFKLVVSILSIAVFSSCVRKAFLTSGTSFIWIVNYSKSQSLQHIIALAKEKEKKHDWVKAADLYERALRKVRKKDFWRREKFRSDLATALTMLLFRLKRTRISRNACGSLQISIWKQGWAFWEGWDAETHAQINHCKTWSHTLILGLRQTYPRRGNK